VVLARVRFVTMLAGVVAIGWSGYYLAGGGGDVPDLAPTRALCWLLGLPLALAAAALCVWLVERGGRSARAATLAGLAGAGFGLANAVGWTVDVTVGGPTTGLVAGCVLVAACADTVPRERLRLVAVVLVAVVAMVAARVLTGAHALALRAVLPPLVGCVAAFVTWRALRLPRGFTPIAVLVFGWAFAWLVGFQISRSLPGPLPTALYTFAEIGIAAAGGGALTAVVFRARTGEHPVAVTLRWTGAMLAGTALGIIGATLVWWLGWAPDRLENATDLWAAGTTWGLALAATVAAAPSIARATQAHDRPHPLAVGGNL